MPSSDPNRSTVVEFLAALRDQNYEQAMGYVTDDVVWHNVSLPKIRGKRALTRAVALADKLSIGFDVQFHNISGDGRVVLTERTDALSVGRFRCEFWVCGVFEFRDNQIAVWRDYFDYGTIGVGVLRGIVGIALPRREQFPLFEPEQAILASAQR